MWVGGRPTKLGLRDTRIHITEVQELPIYRQLGEVQIQTITKVGYTLESSCFEFVKTLDWI